MGDRRLIIIWSCTCGTGDYCHKHHKYGLEPKRQDREVRADGEDVVYQRCGGGRRVIKKRIQGA